MGLTNKTRGIVQGVCPHGRVPFAVVNEPKWIKYCAKDIADMVAAGFTMSVVDLLVTFDAGCDDCRARKDS